MTNMGGQSVPNFDYGMALGVAKTYKRTYRENLIKSIELLIGEIDLEENINNIFEVLENQYNLLPTLGDNTEYKEREAEYLNELLDNPELVKKVQNLQRKMTYKDTDKRTYQAMKALVHNLNTMHSRAGAQIPFSSINYGTDTSLEGRMVIKKSIISHRCWIRQWGKHPYSQYRSLK